MPAKAHVYAKQDHTRGTIPMSDKGQRKPAANMKRGRKTNDLAYRSLRGLPLCAGK